MTDLRQAAQQALEAYDKTAMNSFVQNLYDEKMQEGKHGHYETMFHVVHEAVKRFAPPQQQAEPVCPECKAAVLYECVACGSNNYPPKRPWVGLTDEEIWSVVSRIGTADSDVNPYITIKDARAIEKLLKERNG